MLAYHDFKWLSHCSIALNLLRVKLAQLSFIISLSMALSMFAALFFIFASTSVKVATLLQEFSLQPTWCQCGVSRDSVMSKREIKGRVRFQTHRKYLFSSLFKVLSKIVFIVFGLKTCLWDTGDNIILLPCNTLQSPWRICVHITSWKPHRTFNHRHT